MVQTTTAKKNMNASRFALYMIPIYALAFYGLLSVFGQSRNLSAVTTEPSLIKQQQQQQFYGGVIQQDDRCLSIEFDEGMDKLLSKYRQVFFLMPSKASGTTLRKFTKQCMKSVNATSFSADIQDNPLNKKKKLQNAFRSQLNLPTLVSNHLTKQNLNSICDIAKAATRDTLIIYVHREETSRMLSGIRQILSMFDSCGYHEKGNKHINHPYLEWVGNECHVNESYVVEKIEERYFEIGNGAARHLTCEAYDCIKDNAPNFVFMHYTKATDVQKLVSKYHCPDMKRDVTANTADEKPTISVVMRNGAAVPLDDWLKAKSQLIELVYDLRSNATCQGTTSDIEHELLSCPDETFQISGRSHDGRKVPFAY